MPGDSHRFDLDHGLGHAPKLNHEIRSKKPMREYRSLSHTRWDCKYHVVFIPKRRKKVIYGPIRKHLGEIFHELAKHKDVEILEGHLMADHVHMCLSIPPKYAVSNIVGYLKGKSAVQIARRFRGRTRNFTGEIFGREAILCRPLAWMKELSEPMFVTKRLKMLVTIS